MKVVQTCNFENAKKFEWMRGVKESGAKVPREYLAKRVAKDKAFLTYICDSAVECCNGQSNNDFNADERYDFREFGESFVLRRFND